MTSAFAAPTRSRHSPRIALALDSLMPQFLYPVDLYSAEYHRQSPAAMSH